MNNPSSSSKGGRPQLSRIGRKVGQWLWYALLVALYVFLLAPLLLVLVISFNADAYLSFPPEEWSLRWYAALAQNEGFIEGLRTSLVIATTATALALLVGVPAALTLTRYKFRGQEALAAFFTLPLMVPTVVLGLGLLLILSPFRLVATYPGLIAAHVVLIVPFVIRTSATSLMTLPPEYQEAASGLGATPWHTFRRVTLPLVAPGVIAGAAIAFLVSFDETVVTLFLVGPSLTTLPVEIFRYVEYRTDPSVAALSVILVGVSVVGVVIIERLLGLGKALGR